MTQSIHETMDNGKAETEKSDFEFSCNDEAARHEPSSATTSTEAPSKVVAEQTDNNQGTTDILRKPCPDGSSSSSDSAKTAQVLLLEEAVEILSKLAALDTPQYTESLVNSSASASSENNKDDDNSALYLQSRLDHLVPRLPANNNNNTGILLSSLSHHIHRLQSRVISLEQESEQHLQEWHAYQESLEDKNHRILKLEKAVSKLHRRNQKLQTKLQRGKSERKSILKHVKDYMGHVKKQEELSVEEQSIANQLQAHERLLKLEHALRRDAVSERSFAADVMLDGNRSRCSSRDTVFSDIDMAGLYPMEQFTEGDESTMTNDEEQSSVGSSVSTSPSLVTEEGVATVRYGSDSSERRASSPLLSSMSHYDYSLKFPQGTKIGLQFQKVPIDKPKKGLLNEDFLEEAEKKELSERSATGKAPPTAATADPKQEISLLDAFWGKNTPNITASSTNHDDHEAYAFLVCGFHGFDSQINVRPTLGARLLRVNGESVSEWTLEQIRDATHPKEGSFSMTFRNEPLNSKQKEILDKAVKAASHQHDESDENLDENDRQRSSPTDDADMASDGEKEEKLPSSSKEKRSMFPAFMQFNQNGADGKKEEAKAEVTEEKNPDREHDQTAAPTKGLSMMSFLNMNQNSSTNTPQDPHKQNLKSLLQNSRDKLHSVHDLPATRSIPGLSTPTKEMQTSEEGAEEQDPQISATPPSQKLKKSMKSMGKKFKGWMS